MSVRRALPLLVALTLLHVAFRAWARGGEAGTRLSLLQSGDTVPELTATSLRTGRSVSLSSPECRVFVLFDSSCPYCEEAAERDRAVEAGLEPGAERLSITWVADQEDSGAGRYVDALAAGHRLVRLDDSDPFKVRAVPAAFLVHGSGVIQKIWRFTGEEEHHGLSLACSRASSGSAHSGKRSPHARLDRSEAR